MDFLNRKIEFVADAISVGYNTDSKDILIEMRSKGDLNDTVCYMYVSVFKAEDIADAIKEAINELVKNNN